jgi:repressor LexA
VSRTCKGPLRPGAVDFRVLFGYCVVSLWGATPEIMPLTKRQREILSYLESHIQSRGYAPSFEEIAEHFSFQSLATVHEHLTNLERKGFIRRSYNESRSIEVLPPRGISGATELPLLGVVAAGMPIEAVLHQETLAVPDAMIPTRGPNYALRVRGDSMIDEHILDGDCVVVHGRQTADNGEMVIALVNGSEATVKKFYREPGGWVRLQPANPTMQPLRFPESDIMIQGVVVGVIRRY